MNKENSRLGRGLSSLLSPNKNKNDIDTNLQSFKSISTSSILANLNQPRNKFSKKELEDLAASLKSQGILQPIVVRKKTEDTFEIIAGERRWRAAQIAGIHEIPALIKEMNDEEALQAASFVTVDSAKFCIPDRQFSVAT